MANCFCFCPGGPSGGFPGFPTFCPPGNIPGGPSWSCMRSSCGMYPQNNNWFTSSNPNCMISGACGSGGGWGNGGWGGGGWGGGGWGSGGWGGGQPCQPCPPCETGPGNCAADAPGCPRAPWLDCASVFGGMYRNQLWEDNLPAGTTGRPLPLDAPLPSQNAGFTGDNIVIQCSGTYQITFFGNFRFSSNSLLTFYVKANGRTLDETVVEKTTSLNQTDSFERTVIVSLCANTTLRALVDNAAPGEGGFTGDLAIPANGLHLSVIRIGAFRSAS